MSLPDRLPSISSIPGIPRASGPNGTTQYVALGGLYVILLALSESDTWGGVAVALAWAAAFAVSLEAINNAKALGSALDANARAGG